MMNDFTRMVLSSFRLIFLMKVVSVSAANAGWLIFYTRFVGALVFRPIVGYMCDRVYIPVLSQKLGKRKSWHLVGSVLTVVFVPLFYSTCFVCSSEPSEWQLMVYYCIITTFVMFSVSCIEIAHLSLISVAAKDQSEAVKLNALRFADISFWLYLKLFPYVFLVKFGTFSILENDQSSLKNFTNSGNS